MITSPIFITRMFNTHAFRFMNTSVLRSSLMALALGCASLAHAAVPGMKITKIFSPNRTDPGSFGVTCIMTDKFAIVAEPYPSASSGSVHLYDPATGAFIRSLVSPTAATTVRFGLRLGARANLLLVDSDYGGLGTTNETYLFDMTTGQLKRTFAPASPIDNNFGWALALTDRYAIISDIGASSNTGAVYVYDLANTNPPLTLTASDGAAGDRFGWALYADKGVLLVGSPYHSGKGAVYRYDLATGTELGKSQPASLGAGDRFGQNIVGWGSNTFVTAPGSNLFASGGGAVYGLTLGGTLDAAATNLAPNPGVNFGYYGSQHGNTVAWSAGKNILIADAARRSPVLAISGEQLGSSETMDGIAVSGDRLLVGYYTDSTFGTDAGAAYLVQYLPEPLAGSVVVSKGDSAPGAAGIAFNDLNSASINATGRTMIGTSLSGTGSNAGTDKGVFDDLATGDLLDLAAKSRDDLGAGVKIASLSVPLLNDTDGLFNAALTGTGVTTLNNQALLRDNGTAVSPMLRTGQAVTAFGGATLLKIGQTAQKNSGGRFSSYVTLRTGVGGTTTANDSGILFFDSIVGIILNGEREGDASPIAGINYGQFTPRVSYGNTVGAFNAMLSGPVAENQAIFARDVNGPATLIARKGAAANGAGGALYSAFLGENNCPSSQPIYRATLSGTGVTTLNNEGVWFDFAAGNPALIARKGSEAPGSKSGASYVWASILQVAGQQNRVIVRGTVRGTGITTANDEIVCLYQEDGSAIVLHREGDPVHGCGTAKAGPILRMEVSATGNYRLIITLIGAATTNNLALLGGNTTKGNTTTESSLRKPELMLRKGTLIGLNSLTGPTRITSIAFAHPGSQDTTGMLAKGLAGVVSSGGTLVKLTLSDGSTHLVKMP